MQCYYICIFLFLFNWLMFNLFDYWLNYVCVSFLIFLYLWMKRREREWNLGLEGITLHCGFVTNFLSLQAFCLFIYLYEFIYGIYCGNRINKYTDRWLQFYIWCCWVCICMIENVLGVILVANICYIVTDASFQILKWEKEEPVAPVTIIPRAFV